MSVRIPVHRDFFGGWQQSMDIRPDHPTTMPGRLTVTSQAGYGLLLTLTDPMGQIYWQVSLRGSTDREIREDESR